MKTNLAINEIVDPEEKVTKMSTVNGIRGCDVQLDCGLRNTTMENLSRCKRICQLGRGGFGLRWLSGVHVGRHGRHDDGTTSSKQFSGDVD